MGPLEKGAIFMSCLGCLHIETAPHTLRTGRVVCIGCPAVTEEEGAIIRHADNLDRCSGRDGRRFYLDRVRSHEGEAVATAVESEYLKLWKARQAK